MKIPASLSTAFGDEFEKTLVDFAIENKLLPDADSIRNERFLTRSVLPHVEKMSLMFNRLETLPANPETEARTGKPGSPIRARRSDGRDGLDPYWKETSNPENFKLAYFLAFMPGNVARTAAVISELARLGFRFPKLPSFRGIEWGAGPASGACGVAAGAVHSEIGIPREGNWALIEQDRSVLSLGEKWASTYFESIGLNWGIRPFHRKVDWTKPLLPRSAPKFHLWLSSFFLNEAEIPLPELAARLVDNWEFHLEEEGIAVLVEPALKINHDASSNSENTSSPSLRTRAEKGSTKFCSRALGTSFAEHLRTKMTGATKKLRGGVRNIFGRSMTSRVSIVKPFRSATSSSRSPRGRAKNSSPP